MIRSAVGALACIALGAIGCSKGEEKPAAGAAPGLPGAIGTPIAEVLDLTQSPPIANAFTPAPAPTPYGGPPPSAEEIAKLPPDGGPEFNRLVFEKSPYLQQHARNPVDWFPWGEEAFKKAKEEGKLIFLSIGYSTCHWCHVMEEESFQNQQVADAMAKDYVAIKVDREERPDIDAIYMEVVTTVNQGHGGWPLTVIMTADKRPLYGATYLPRETGVNRIGMIEVLPKVAGVWKSSNEKALETAKQIEEALAKRRAVSTAGGELGQEALKAGYTQLAGTYDKQFGGFGSGPKFPTPHNLMFLLRVWQRTGDPQAMEMVRHTMERMRVGGIWDHIGFGFHRYAVEPEWLVPHWEKMLSDQATISMAFLEAYQATNAPDLGGTIRDIFTYVTRDMASPEGGFYTAEDADSEGAEGKFYQWRTDEVRRALGTKDGDLFIRIFGMDDGGNVLDPATGQRNGRNILYMAKPLAQIAADLKVGDVNDMQQWFETKRQALLKARESHVRPLRDDKILADWNGLMIASLAKGGATLYEDRWTSAAHKAATFVWEKMRAPDGRLLHRYRAGEAGLPAHLEDYAYTTWGMIELYEATWDAIWLKRAIELNDLALKHFWDDKGGGFFQTANDGEDLGARLKDASDYAQPSGNSVATMNMLRLARYTGRKELEAKAHEVFRAFSGEIKRTPSAYTQMLMALDFALSPPLEIVIAGKKAESNTTVMIQTTRLKFLPNKIMIFREETDPPPPITELATFTKPQGMVDGKTTMYICEDYACKKPMNDPKEARAAIAALAAPKGSVAPAAAAPAPAGPPAPAPNPN